MKNLKFQFTIAILFALSISAFSQCKTELTKEQTDLKFNTECIENFINNIESNRSLQVLDQLVAENENGKFLLSKCVIDSEKTWVYIMKLKTIDKFISFSKEVYLNSCESEELSIDVFNFENGKIKGCKIVNHKISIK